QPGSLRPRQPRAGAAASRADGRGPMARDAGHRADRRPAAHRPRRNRAPRVRPRLSRHRRRRARAAAGAGPAGRVPAAAALPRGSPRVIAADRPMDAAMSPPAVSVVIPCYQQAEYLVDAVESVVGQTYPNWEIVIVDDGSTDDTATIVENLI